MSFYSFNFHIFTNDKSHCSNMNHNNDRNRQPPKRDLLRHKLISMMESGDDSESQKNFNHYEIICLIITRIEMFRNSKC